MRTLSIIIGLLCWSAVSPLYGSETAVELDYQRGPRAQNCVSGTDLKVHIGAQLGYNPFRANAELSIRIRTDKKITSGYKAKVWVRKRGQSKRKLQRLETDSNNCRKLTKPIVLAVSLAIDPSIGVARQPLSSSTSTSSLIEQLKYRVSLAQAASRATVYQRLYTSADQKTTNARLDSQNVQFQPFAGVSTHIGVVPNLSFAPGIGIEARLNNAALRLGGTVGLPGEYAVDGGAVESTTLIADAAVCGIYAPFFGCGVVVGGKIEQRGIELDQSRQTSSHYLATGARIGGDLYFTNRLGLRIRGQLLANLIELNTRANNRTVWETPQLAAQLGTFVFFNFP